MKMLFATLAAAMLGGAVAAAEPAPRIVTLGGDVTEIVFMLGDGARIVATDETSSFPEAAANLPKLGYLRSLTPEAIIAAGPDLVIASSDAGPPTVLAQLSAAGLRVETLSGEDSLAGVLAKIARTGALLGRLEQADTLARDITGRMEAVAAAIAAQPERPRTLFVLAAGQGGLMAAGGKTAAKAMIELAGGVNAVDGYDGFKPLSPEAAVAAAPEVIVVPAHVVNAVGGLDALRAFPEIALTPAGSQGRIVVMDALLLLGFGPRTPDAVAALARALHPSLVLPQR
jgi:iron complex transport system substrate-binding protein